MQIAVFPDKLSLAEAAANDAANAICQALKHEGLARIIAATGASQFEFLEHLTKAPGIDWSRVELFHLDEYLDMPATHPASFRRYLHERLIDKAGITRFHLLDGQGDVTKTLAQISAEIRKRPIDVAFVGIGENGHLAFNDPPANFETDEAYILVELDEACRRQQFGEGWFNSLDDVPRRAISMTVRQVLKSKQILCVVPDARKAKAVAQCFQGEISSDAPASILRRHPNATVYLDKNSAALLKPEMATTVET